MELAAADDPPVKAEEIAHNQRIPVKFLEKIMGDLKMVGIVSSQRGAEGGYALARGADEVTVAEVLRTIEGPLASVRDVKPEDLDYKGPAKGLRPTWVALRCAMRSVLESVTLADVLTERFPDDVAAMVADPGAWESD